MVVAVLTLRRFSIDTINISGVDDFDTSPLTRLDVSLHFRRIEYQVRRLEPGTHTHMNIQEHAEFVNSVDTRD